MPDLSPLIRKDLLSLEHFRDRLSHIDSLPQLLTLGVLSGLVAGLIILAFRLVVDIPLSLYLPGGDPENFEGLSIEVRAVLPVAGSLLLCLLIWRLAPARRKVGVVHVLERLRYHQGHLPAGNLLAQFATAAIALLSGHSVGREGPAIHLGAGGASLVGQWMRVPNNCMRLLVACGTAAGISAAFSTPLAGVVFAMEVVLLEYTVLGFTPVIVAAVTADLVMRASLGAGPLLDVPALGIGTLSEIPMVMLLGLLIGLLAGGFNRLMLGTVSLQTKLPLYVRLLLAGVLTGAVACIFPQVMGVGYDTLQATLLGHKELLLLAGLLLAKWLLTPVVLGLGIPAGLIGPTFVIGALAGALLGNLGQMLSPDTLSHTGLYAMIGMGAMMGAVLNAPLAALIALLELTGNPHIILPGMLAIVISNLTVRAFFGLPSIFQSLLQAQGLDYRQEPLAQVLSRAAVGSLMSRNFLKATSTESRLRAAELSQQDASWILVLDDEPRALLPRTDLTLWLEQHEGESDELKLLEIPAHRRDAVTISFRATLQEAADCMRQRETDILCVSSNRGDIIGLLTRAQLEAYYLRKQAL
ncbi:chloride channel protein [Marinobacterium nitratireducens]|uniref:Chloride channel protein n=1 Tax=Marinobacterium nitratireducens TaxID=518897 RepID=A0A918DYQ4_9GAMM|nr:chloride channel protein [Marinobacterium nitratireducens]GGO88527.1 chloride channel protein [Marinobacterium nitratireducens]